MFSQNRNLILGVIVPLVIIIAIVGILKSRGGGGADAEVPVKIDVVMGEGITKYASDIDKWNDVVLPLSLVEGDYIRTADDGKNILLVNVDGSIRMHENTSLKLESKSIGKDGVLKLKFMMGTGRVWVDAGANAIITLECKYGKVEPSGTGVTYEANTFMDEQTLESTDTIYAWRGGVKVSHVSDETKVVEVAEGQGAVVGEEQLSTASTIDTAKLDEWDTWNRDLKDVRAFLKEKAAADKIAAEKSATPEATSTGVSETSTPVVPSIVTSATVAAPGTKKQPGGPSTPSVPGMSTPGVPPVAPPSMPAVTQPQMPSTPSGPQPPATRPPGDTFSTGVNQPQSPPQGPQQPAKRPPGDTFNPGNVNQPQPPPQGQQKPATRPPNDNFDPNAVNQPQSPPQGPQQPGTRPSNDNFNPNAGKPGAATPPAQPGGARPPGAPEQPKPGNVPFNPNQKPPGSSHPLGH